MHWACVAQMGKLASSNLDAYGPPTSLELAPTSIAPCDDGPTRYAHTMKN
jgi:hypothetical protein